MRYLRKTKIIDLDIIENLPEIRQSLFTHTRAVFCIPNNHNNIKFLQFFFGILIFKFFGFFALAMISAEDVDVAGARSSFVCLFIRLISVFMAAKLI